VRRWVPVGVILLVVVGVAVLAISSGQPADSPQTGAPSSATPMPDAQSGASATPADAAYDRQFGSPSEFTVSSTVSETVQLAEPLTGFLLRTRYTGEGIAEVTFLDAAQKVAAHGVSAPAGHVGVALVGGIDSPTLAAVRVDQSAAGSWTLSLVPVASAPELTSSSSVSGQFDAVFRYDGAESTFTFTHGPGASIDQLEGRQAIGLEQLDATTTRVTLRTGASVVTVLAAGSPWMLEPVQWSKVTRAALAESCTKGGRVWEGSCPKSGVD
jgi:hypothetical protein